MSRPATISIAVSPEWYEAIERARGYEPRSAWIRRHLEPHVQLAADEPARADSVNVRIDEHGAAYAVGEAQEQPGFAGGSGSDHSAPEPASRRPRAPDTPRSNGSPSAESGHDEPAGCPECSGSVVEGKCEECGWLA